jgi:hypothetical protein
VTDATPTAGSPIDELIASATPAEREAKICIAGALNVRFATLEAELAELQQQRFAGAASQSLGDVDPRRAIAEEIERVREEMRANEHTFTFRALPSKAWSDIRAAHAPREGQREVVNLETFPPALVAATCVALDGKPTEVTVEQVHALFDVLNEGQRDELFNAAWEANTGRVSVPFSAVASVVLQSSEPK